MTDHLINFPASRVNDIGQCLENARQIVRAPQGMFDDGIILDACALMQDFGTWLDHDEATKIIQAISRSSSRERRPGIVAPMAAAAAYLVAVSALIAAVVALR